MVKFGATIAYEKELNISHIIAIIIIRFRGQMDSRLVHLWYAGQYNDPPYCSWIDANSSTLEHF